MKSNSVSLHSGPANHRVAQTCFDTAATDERGGQMLSAD